MNRRSLLKSALVVLAGGQAYLPDWITSAKTQGAAPVWRHGLTKFGELKYPAGFKQFDYVNPNAPRGGSASQIALGTFDNFNTAVSGVKGNIAPATSLIYEQLTTGALDEVATYTTVLSAATVCLRCAAQIVFTMAPVKGTSCT